VIKLRGLCSLDTAFCKGALVVDAVLGEDAAPILNRTTLRGTGLLLRVSDGEICRRSCKVLIDAGLFRHGWLPPLVCNFPPLLSSFLKAGEDPSIADTSSSNRALASALNFIGSRKSSSELSPTENCRCTGAVAGAGPWLMVATLDKGEPRFIVGRDGCARGNWREEGRRDRAP